MMKSNILTSQYNHKQAIKLMDEVEELFVKYFAEDDKRKAMKYLKPCQRKESHAVTFFIGNYSNRLICILLKQNFYACFPSPS